MKVSVLTPTIRGKEGLKPVLESLNRQTHKDFDWLIEEHDPKDPPDFNSAMNRMIRKSKGELIVIVQDYITIPDDGLERFVKAFDPNIAYTAPVVKEGKEDWRIHRGKEEECNFMEWECDYGSIPTEMIKNIGGFDEALDEQWGFDNVNVGLRIELEGYKIKCLNDNVAHAVDHNSFIEHPYQKLRDPSFHNQRLDDIRRGLKITL